MSSPAIHTIHSVSEMHRAFALPKPQHPLISVINLNTVRFTHSEIWNHFTSELYCIAVKRGDKGKMRYGQSYYDFDEGVMSFTAPKQVMSVTKAEDIAVEGYLLMVHPDFFRHYPLMKTIKEYNFFSYTLNEALFLSDKEEAAIIDLIKKIEQEYQSAIDKFSQDVMISQIELLLTYVNRFYNRQFITRKNLNHDLLAKMESLLNAYFESDSVHQRGLPTVAYLAEQLHVSAGYLSDTLKSLTGQSTQQHIHDKVIEKAKEILSTTSLSVSEIAYQLGFEYPQSFNKLFKQKTNVSPLEFRQSFN